MVWGSWYSGSAIEGNGVDRLLSFLESIVSTMGFHFDLTFSRFTQLLTENGVFLL